MSCSLYHALSKPPILTTAIGAKCSDGIALITDAKLTKILGISIRKPRYGRKLFGDIAHLPMVYTGSEEVFDFFRKYIIGDIVINRNTSESYTPENLIVKISRLVEVINRRVGNITTGEYFEILAAEHRGDNSKLYYVNKRGKFKEVKYEAIGSGTSIANDFCGAISRKNVSMKEFTKAAFCSIMYLDRLPNSTVGVRPDGIPMMRYLHTTRVLDKPPPRTHIEEFQRIAQEELDVDTNKLKSLIKRVHTRIKIS